MNEQYLQLIWKQQRFLVPELKLTDGRAIRIKYPGHFNKQLSGPDFELGKIVLDEIEWCGPIELHVRSSHWYKHRHDFDQAYCNVILHVVYEHDSPVHINGFEIPTLELKNYVSAEHLWKFSGIEPTNGSVICSKLVHKVDIGVLKATIRAALHEKLKRKKQGIEHLNREEQFYRLLASAFGMGVNKSAFEELTIAITWEQLKVLSPSQKFHLLYVASGLLSDRRDNVTIGGYKWNFKGTRPSNFPTKRIGQFAELVCRLPIEKMAGEHDIITLDTLFNTYLTTSDRPMKESLFSVAFSDHLKINTLAPFIWSNDELANQKVIRYLCKLPAEENAVLKKWKSYGVFAENAADSQGLIALHRYGCSEKKCLSCGIGNVLLNKSE